MKRLIITVLIVLSPIMLLTGCLGLQLGGGSETVEKMPTAGQQLIDLKKAKDAGAITEAEFQAKKAQLLKDK